jgi:hypothetical protein
MFYSAGAWIEKSPSNTNAKIEVGFDFCAREKGRRETDRKREMRESCK